MNEEKPKTMIDVLISVVERLDAMEKRLEINTPSPTVQLTFDDFRGKRLMPGKQRRVGGLFPIYTGIKKEEMKYFESVLVRLFEHHHVKIKVSDLFRGVIDDFITRYTVEAACELMNKGKSKYIVK